MSHKYDGKLTDKLIQTVIDAERRLWAAGDFGVTDASTGLPGGKAAILSEVETGRLAELADYQKRVKPTDTERAEAWRRTHLDYEPEDGGDDET